MATIRQRSPGTWTIQAYLGTDAGGRRRFKTTTVRGTKADARKAATALQAQVDAGKVRPTERLTVAQLVDRWVEHRSADWSPTTARDAPAVLARHALPRIGAVRLDRLTTADVDQLYANLRRDGVGAPTVHAVHRWLKAALNTAVRWDLIARNPADRARPPKKPKARSTAASIDQVRAVLVHLEDDPMLAAYVRLAAHTGARRGTLCGLRWDDLDLDARQVLFQRAVITPKGRLVVKELKVDKPYPVALGAGTVEALRSWRLLAVERALAVGLQPSWVFPAERHPDRPVRPDRMTYLWRRAAAAAGITDLRLHDLRHGTGTFGLAEGFDAVTVAGRLGHSPDVLLRIYGHQAPARDQALADAIDAALDAS